MFSFPFAALLVAYAIFIVIFLIFSAANVYHIYHTGTFTIVAAAVTIIVSVWSLLVLVATIPVIMGIDWGTAVVLFGPGGTISFESYAP